MERMNVSPLLPAGSDRHPLLITPTADSSCEGLRDYLLTHRAPLHQLLLQHGGILFRGFRVVGPVDFEACAESLGARPYGYVGGNSPRTRVASEVFTSTEYPASEVISLHNEMSYLPTSPRRLFFYSHLPAKSGGQTSLANGLDVRSAMPEEIIAAFRKRGLKYIRNFKPNVPLGKSWQDTYSTTDQAEVAQLVARQGSECTWLPGGTLQVTTRCQALARHPETGQEVWFNQADQWHPSALAPRVRALYEGLLGKDQLPHDCRYADDAPIEESVMAKIRQTLNQCKLLFDWKQCDLLVIDNILMMHGRESFTGERKTLAYLSQT
jgi:alpha-ketoglutarate-dependent taurine dioxygenase